MATIDDFAQQYADDLRAMRGRTGFVSAEPIATKINQLLYENKQPVSLADKLEIVEKIARLLSPEKMLMKEASDKSFHDLVDHLKQLVGG